MDEEIKRRLEAIEANQAKILENQAIIIDGQDRIIMNLIEGILIVKPTETKKAGVWQPPKETNSGN